MRQGSYAEILKGMRVVGPAGETLGGVHEVIVDQESGIFVGLSISPNLFVHPMFVPGDRVDRLEHGVVHVTLVESELRPYISPVERHHVVETAFEGLR